MTLWFVVPAHGRIALTRICLNQLARTCETLTENGIEASAVVIADDENLTTASALGFGTVRQENAPLGRKWNDGFQFACDPEFNPRPADYVIPCGSDDWIDPQLLLTHDLPLSDEILCFRRGAFVREDGQRLARLKIGYEGGLGIRVIPRALIERAGFRPAEEDRRRAIDTSTLRGIGRARLLYHDLHDLQIVDWKTPGAQLNTYRDCLRYLRGKESEDPFGELAEVYPSDALEEMRALYGVRQRVLA